MWLMDRILECGVHGALIGGAIESSAVRFHTVPSSVGLIFLFTGQWFR